MCVCARVCACVRGLVGWATFKFKPPLDRCWWLGSSSCVRACVRGAAHSCSWLCLCTSEPLPPSQSAAEQQVKIFPVSAAVSHSVISVGSTDRGWLVGWLADSWVGGGWVQTGGQWVATSKKKARTQRWCTTSHSCARTPTHREGRKAKPSQAKPRQDE